MATTTKARRIQSESEVEKDAKVVPALQTVKVKNVEFEFSPDPMDWGVETLEKLDEGKLASALAGILGPTQYKAFQRLNVSTRDAIEVLNDISAQAGVEDSGN